MDETGTWVISLDFELYWGVRDSRSLESYRRNLLAVREVIPEILERFSQANIHATWATVGLLFAKNRQELKASIPNRQPNYTFSKFNPYQDLSLLGEDERQDPYHYAGSLINMIRSTSGQEIATHTFSHYYCLEDGQELEAFREDIKAARKIAGEQEFEMKSIVFPRNQYSEDCLKACKEEGIIAYRGNESSWMYRPRSRENESPIRRACRLADAYINLSGDHLHSLNGMKQGPPYNIPSSRFLRPYSPRLKFLERLRFRRMAKSMTRAALEGKVYHLWWHPHNFGSNQAENLKVLDQLIAHFCSLRSQYGMKSQNMAELVDRLNSE